ncbi:hypothetical protein T03_16183 [Trichinella britovi]|uniref:Uncharacterized protein n=1 Tax=Trichinella britovi TaxID=45882 RepID=A0A0V1D531_TRIBR|nr:hypothetical protein T03_16183 [Trichinella britovi]
MHYTSHSKTSDKRTRRENFRNASQLPLWRQHRTNMKRSNETKVVTAVVEAVFKVPLHLCSARTNASCCWLH